MTIKNKIELLEEPCINQNNYTTDLPNFYNDPELFFWETALRELERDERDTVKSLIAEMRYL